MKAIDHHKAYLFSLSCGLAWEFGPCEGSDEEVGAWVDRFASYMGLECGAASSARRLWFGKIHHGSGTGEASFFLPGLPAHVPAADWRAQGNSGMLLLRHPGVRDIYCGLYPDGKPAVARMRRPLVPVFEEAIRAGGLLLHGALVERQGAGVILVGRSGAGKTTCCRRLPSGWQVLGTLLRPGDGIEFVPCRVEELKRGDVIIFILPGQGERVVHRVISTGPPVSRQRGMQIHVGIQAI